MPGMRDWMRRNAANLLTGSRLLSCPALVVGAGNAPQHRGAVVLAIVAFVVAAASDVWDGRVARRYGQASERGRVFDHLADISFLMVAFTTYVCLGLLPWWVPLSVLAAFGFYVFDSRRRTRAAPSLIGSRIGHLGGICNYVVVGVLVFNHSAGLELLPDWLLLTLFGLVPFYSSASIATRLLPPVWRARTDTLS